MQPRIATRVLMCMQDVRKDPSARWVERALVSSVGMFGAGSALALLVHLTPASLERARARAEGDVRVALWATDREADEVVGLDEDLLPAVRVSVPAPIEVEARRDGGAWILSAAERAPLGARSLIRISAAGERLSQVALGPCLDLATQGGEAALAIEFARGDDGAARAVRIGTDSVVHVLYERPGLLRIAGSRTRTWLGSEDGTIVRLDLETEAAIQGEAHLPGPVGDLALASSAGWLWALEIGSSHRILLLDQDLRVAWSAETGLNATRLAPVPDADLVWLFAADAPHVRCVGDGGSTVTERRAMRLTGVERAAAWRSRGALFATPGAILHVDRDGRSRPGQGGFRYLTDLAAVENAPP